MRVKGFLVSRLALFLLLIVCLLVPAFIVTKAYAAVGVYEKINFQGKLINSNGTNVADNDYSVVFTLYDASSAGNNLWDETQTVTVTDGVFQVELGAVDSTIAAV